MRAAVLVELNKPLLLTDVDLTELSTGQVLVRVLVSGICGSQLHDINGNKGNGKFLPHLIGHEGCGIVENIGPGVLTVKPGDKVVMHWRPGLGIDSNFPQYILDGKKFSSGKVNTLTEQAIVSENRLTVIPSDTNPEFAALLGCSLTTALGVIDNESYLKFGETVAVVGCGGVGLIVLAAARLRGAGEIYAIDNSPFKKDLSFNHGANFFHESVTQLPENIDLLIDTTGSVKIISDSFKKLSNKGRILMIGQPSPDQNLIIPNAIKLFSGSGLLIKATQGGGTIPHEDIPRYLKLLSLGYISIEKLVTNRYTLSEVNEAFNTLKSGNSGRIMIGINK